MAVKILLIASKQPDYSRIKLIRQSLEANAEVDCIFSERSSYFLRIVEVCWRFVWLRKRDYDLVVVGFFAQLIFPFIRLFWRGKLLSDCYISLYDSLIFDRAMYSDGGIVSKFVRWLDGTLLRGSDLSMTDTKEHAKYLGQEFRVDPAKIRPIPISADEHLFPFQPEAYRPYQEGTIFKVLFFGAYIPLQGTDVIIRAAAKLKDQSVEFHMIGAGQTYEETLALADELGVSNVVFHGWQTIDKIPLMAKDCDLILGIFGVTEKATRVIPNKVFEALSLGRPVVTGGSSAIREYLEDNSSIMLTPLGDVEALAEKILWAKTHHAAAVEIGLKGRQVFEESLSPAQVGCVVQAVVDELLNS